MPSFSMDELRRSVFGSASDAHQMIETRNQAGRETVGQVRREKKRLASESERLIREFMSQQKEPVLFLDICDHLERRPSPLLRQIVNAMVARGEIIQEEDFGAGPLIARHVYRRAK